MRSAIRFKSAHDIRAWVTASGIEGSDRIRTVALKSLRGSAALIGLENGTQLFVKRCASGSASAEFGALGFANDNVALHPYRAVMPPFVHYDNRTRVLVTRGLAQHVSIEEQCNGFLPDVDVLRATASRLAGCHGASQSIAVDNRDVDRHMTSPVPVYDRVTPAQVARAVGRDYFAFLRSVQTANDALTDLRASWNADAFVHGDFKADNILVSTRDADAIPDSDIRFVDWELSGRGDRRWDVGSFVGQLVFYWVDSIPPTEAVDPARWPLVSSIQFDDLRRAVTVWLRSYNDAFGTYRSDTGWWRRVMQYAGVFLLHRALATMEFTGALTPLTYCCVHVGKTMVMQPMESLGLFAPHFPART